MLVSLEPFTEMHNNVLMLNFIHKKLMKILDIKGIRGIHFKGELTWEDNKYVVTL